VPEGDTVWRTALNLDRALTGSELVAADLRVPAHATLDLSGQQVVATVARGKHLLTRIGERHTLHTHLKMYKAETLFLSGVNPFVAVSEVRDLGRVVRLARRLMMSNKLTPMQSTTGVARRGEQNWVYGRGGRPCRRCGTRIRSQLQGPPLRERTTYWCPTCQP